MLTSDKILKNLEDQFRSNKIEGVDIHTIDNNIIQFRDSFRVVFHPITKDIVMVYGVGYHKGEQYIIPCEAICKIQAIHTSKSESLV